MSENKDVEIIEKAYPMDINFGGVYSPEVTVFRNASDSYAFLDEPYKVGIVSVAALVAGAFGCGAFRLPGTVVASLFHEILNEPEFKNKFRKITFAILAKIKSDERFLPFYDLFN